MMIAFIVTPTIYNFPNVLTFVAVAFLLGTNPRGNRGNGWKWILADMQVIRLQIIFLLLTTNAALESLHLLRTELIKVREFCGLTNGP